MGTLTVPFTGIFNGNRHVLMNWQMDLPGGEYVGLFGYLGLGSRITGLGVEGALVNGHGGVGALVGCSEGRIEECYADAAVSGGMYGQLIGGLAGYSLRGEITAGAASGAVRRGSGVGGLTGGASGASITACYSTTAVLGDNFVGSLAGLIEGASVTACYAAGHVSGAGNSGGLVSVSWGDAQVLSSFYDMDGTDQHGSAGGRGLTSVQMGEVFYFQAAGWNAYPWVMNASAPPRLDWEGLGWPAIPEPGPLPLSGSGTEVDPFLVGTAAEFSLLNWRVADLEYMHVRLTADVDLEGVNLYPIGDFHAPFNGVFDGGNHVLSNGKIDLVNEDTVGMFGRVGESGAIDNLSVRRLDYRTGLRGRPGWSQ